MEKFKFTASIVVRVGRLKLTLYSRGKNWGLVHTAEFTEAGTFETEQEARAWISEIFGNADEWIYNKVAFV